VKKEREKRKPGVGIKKRSRKLREEKIKKVTSCRLQVVSKEKKKDKFTVFGYQFSMNTRKK